MPRPLVLLSNDDGYRAHGIRLLKKAMAAWADVVVCAPDSEQSTTSHSLSLNRPLRLTEIAPDEFSVDGTPADCVYVALHGNRILKRRPELVVSGLNHGLNLGTDVFYSGTVAAAREAALKGYRALAVSADAAADFERASQEASRLAHAIVAEADGPCLFNVNFPKQGSWILRATRLGRRYYQDEVEFRKDPRGREYLWIGGARVTHELVDGSDTDAHDRGEVGVTPLILDLWDGEAREGAKRVVDAVTGIGSKSGIEPL